MPSLIFRSLASIVAFSPFVCLPFALAAEVQLTPVIAEPVELKKSAASELPPPLELKEVAPIEYSANPNFKLSENVELKDFFFHFALNSEHFGEIQASSLDMLKVRAHELEVLAAVDSTEDNGFAKGAAGKFVDTGKAAKDTIVTPVKTIEAVGHGISGYGQNAFDFIRRKDRKQPKDSFFLGDDMRKLAAKLDVDYYSTNPHVQEMLERKAKLRAVGSNLVGVSISVGASFFFPVSIALSTVRFRENQNARIESSSAIELYRYNDGLLKKMGVADSQQRETFLQFPGMTPRQRTEALADLATLTQVPDITPYLNSAVETHPGEGVWQVQCADLLAKYNKNGSALVSLQPLGSAMLAQTNDGKSVIVFPADLLFWSKDAAKVFAGFETPAAQGQRECVVSGKVTEMARKQIAELGFSVRENFLLEPAVNAETVPLPAVPAAEAVEVKAQ